MWGGVGVHQISHSCLLLGPEKTTNSLTVVIQTSKSVIDRLSQFALKMGDSNVKMNYVPTV